MLLIHDDDVLVAQYILDIGMVHFEEISLIYDLEYGLLRYGCALPITDKQG